MVQFSCVPGSAPAYAICVDYKAGSKDQRKGRTGFAHLFEHMMLKGSENVGVGELDFLIHTNGGNSNGTTNTDPTAYCETLPKNQLDLGLYLEADRMRGLVITKENLENQRQAVKEERRLRNDNQAYGQTSEKLEELVYDGLRQLRLSPSSGRFDGRFRRRFGRRREGVFQDVLCAE